MGDDGKWVVRHTLKPAHDPAATHKGLSTYDGRGYSHAFQGQSVVQTARRAGPSISGGGNHQIAFPLQFGHNLGGAGREAFPLLRVATVAKS